MTTVPDVGRDSQGTNRTRRTCAGVGVALPDGYPRTECRKTRSDTSSDSRSPTGNDRDPAGQQDVRRINCHDARYPREQTQNRTRRACAV